MGEIVSTVSTADRCKFSTYGYACGKHVEHGRYLCEEHAKATCASCDQPATHGCDFCGQFVCGTPLCDECTFGTDDSKSSGAWGFMNHIHISRPEFADKHMNHRLKEENAALARKAEAYEREKAEDAAEIERLRAAMGSEGQHFVQSLVDECSREIERRKIAERQAEALTGIGSAHDLISDWPVEGTDDLPDETPVRIEIGKRCIISDNLGSLRRARSLTKEQDNAE